MATRVLKTDFKNVIFLDKCRATPDGPEGWVLGFKFGWVLKEHQPRSQICRQQGGGGTMF